MNRWDAEPFWQWWDAQMALMAQAKAPAPDPQLQAAVTEIAQLLREEARGTHWKRLGALRHGKKPWNWRR